MSTLKDYRTAVVSIFQLIGDDVEPGITDIEMIDWQTFHLIIEAKRGWLLLGAEQLTQYSLRSDFRKAGIRFGKAQK